VTLYKPGDIIFDRYYNENVYLVLEVDDKEKVYNVFALRHRSKVHVAGKKINLYLGNEKYYTLLKDANLNDLL